jgi:hypothetical protein
LGHSCQEKQEEEEPHPRCDLRTSAGCHTQQQTFPSTGEKITNP